MTSELKRALTDEELSAIIARAEKATPSPWLSVDPTSMILVNKVDCNGAVVPRWCKLSIADATFIAAARSDPLRLAAELRRAREALGKATGFLLNAKIDLETGAPKRTAIATIEGGLKMIRAALEEPSDV